MKTFVAAVFLSCGALTIAGEPGPLDPQPLRLEASPVQNHIWIQTPKSGNPTLLMPSLSDPIIPTRLDAPGPGYRKHKVDFRERVI